MGYHERGEPRPDQRPENEFLAAALDYAAHGFSVFPCDPDPSSKNAKQPLIPRDKGPDGKPIAKTGGFYKATTDEATIRAWWRRWPLAMIGLRMGEASGAFAIDPDAPKKDGDADGRVAWASLLAKHQFAPLTHTHMTPGGGRHLLFRFPEGRKITNKTGQLPPGIDVRGEGGYVIAPPSKLLDGRSYLIEEPEHAFEFADPPPWLLDLLEPKPRAANPSSTGPAPKQGQFSEGLNVERYVASAVEGECQAVASSTAGGRNNRLNKAAYKLGTLVGAKALDAGDAMRRLLDAAVSCGLVADKGEPKALATIESGLTSGAVNPRQMPEPKARRQRPVGPDPITGEWAGGAPPGDGGEDGATSGGEGDGPDETVIFMLKGQLPKTADEAEAAILAAGKPLYARAGTLVRPVLDVMRTSGGGTTFSAKFREMCADSLCDLMGRVARFMKYDGRAGEWVPDDPTIRLASTMLAREGEWKAPRCSGIITVPTLRPDGSIITVPGYDAATQLLFKPDPALVVPDIVERPTRLDAERALALLDGLLDGYPFVEDFDRSVGLSCLITPIVRGAMSMVPMHVVRAHSPGTGKSHLVDLASVLATGQRCGVIAVGKTEEETEKRLGALLIEAAPVISIDNVNGDLGGEFLCQLTERPVVKVRPLGKSKTVQIENRSTVFATGNNLRLVGDMTRRIAMCSLDAGVEQPELREFKFDPIKRVMADRGVYVAAVLTLVRAYIVAGRPSPCPPIGSYGEWSDLVRSALVWLGRADPLESMKTAREEDPQLAAIRELFSEWERHFGVGPDRWQKSRDLIDLATSKGLSFNGNDGSFQHPEFRDLLLREASSGPERIDTRRLGMWLARIKGRVVDGLRLEMRADNKHGSRFWIERADAPSPPRGTEF